MLKAAVPITPGIMADCLMVTVILESTLGGQIKAAILQVKINSHFNKVLPAY